MCKTVGLLENKEINEFLVVEKSNGFFLVIFNKTPEGPEMECLLSPVVTRS